MATAVQPQIDKRPRQSWGCGQAVTSGTPVDPICTYWIINITTATSVSFTDMNGNAISLGTLPIGVYIFELQAQACTLGTSADGTITGWSNP